jgi:hypothetical protein
VGRTAGGSGWLALGDPDALTAGAHARRDRCDHPGGRPQDVAPSVVAFHHFHGAATRIPAEAIAFGLRQEHFMVEIVAGWQPMEQRRGAPALGAGSPEKPRPVSLPAGYANLLGSDDREQAAAAYGDNAAWLGALKRRFDPDRVFASAIPLPEGWTGPVTFETHFLVSCNRAVACRLKTGAFRSQPAGESPDDNASRQETVGYRQGSESR